MTSKQTELLRKVSEDVAFTRQAITWLNGRVVKLEAWRDSHPRMCPAEKKQGDVLKVRALEVAIIAVVLTLLQMVLKLVGWL